MVAERKIVETEVHSEGSRIYSMDRMYVSNQTYFILVIELV